MSEEKFSLGMLIDTRPAQKSIEDLLQALQVSVEKITSGDTLDKKLLDVEMKKVRLMHEQIKTASESLKVATEEVKLMEKKVSLQEKLRRVGSADDGWLADFGRGGRPLTPREQGLVRVGNVVGTAAQSFQQASFQGFSGSSIAYGIGNVLNTLGPVGQLFGVVANLVGNEFKNEQDRQELRARLFRSAGERGRQTFLGTEGFGGPWSQDDMERLGLTVQDRARLIEGIERGGVSSAAAFPLTGVLESKFGLGEAAIGQMGSFRRAGVGDDRNISALGDSIGIGLATGLERGRFGEVMGNLARAAASSTTGFFSADAAIRQQLFIGGLGPAFQGATPAAAATEQMFDKLSTGASGGLARIQALQTLQKRYPGANYLALMSHLAEGAKGAGGVSTEEDVLNLASDPDVLRAWSGSNRTSGVITEEKRAAGQKLATLRGLSQEDGLRFTRVLEGYFAKGAAFRKTGGAGVVADLLGGVFGLPSDFSRLRQIVHGQKTTGEGGPVVQDIYEQGGSPSLAPRTSSSSSSRGAMTVVHPPPPQRTDSAHSFTGGGGVTGSWTRPGPGRIIRWPFAQPGKVDNFFPDKPGDYSGHGTYTLRNLVTGQPWSVHVGRKLAEGGSTLWNGNEIGWQEVSTGDATSSGGDAPSAVGGAGSAGGLGGAVGGSVGGRVGAVAAGSSVGHGGQYTLSVIVDVLNARTNAQLSRGLARSTGQLFSWVLGH